MHHKAHTYPVAHGNCTFSRLISVSQTPVSKSAPALSDVAIRYEGGGWLGRVLFLFIWSSS